jgi:glycerol kinase
MSPLFLALDQGGHASRAIVFDGRARVVAEAFAPVATMRDGEGHVEHDPEEVIGSLRQAVDAACAGIAGAGDRIAAAGLATQRSSIACWNRRSGAALAPVISWQDRRNAEWLRRLEPQGAAIRAATGLVLTPHYGASKMRWCLDHVPAVREALAAGELAIGPLASFILWRLLDERPFVADPANASRTQLWDPETQDWSPPLVALFGIPPAALPRCVTSRHAYGTLATPRGPVPLTVTTGDQSAVPFAFGPLDPATAYVNVGTGAFVQRAIRDRLPAAPRMLASVVWSDATGVDYTLEGTVNGAGSALDWLAEREGVDVAALLGDLGRSGGAGLQPPLFMNGVSGLGAPFWASGFESRFVGAGSPAERCLAVLESIVFLLVNNLNELRPHGPAFRRIVLTGGLAASDHFCRCLANLAGTDVFRSREREATARGLAYLVAGQPPDWPAAADGETIAPAPDPGLATRFDAWLAAMRAALPASTG